VEWQLRRGPSTVAALTGDSATYAVHLLRVAETEDLYAAFAEFCSDAGMFTAVFTSNDRMSDQPGVFKLISRQIENEYFQLLQEQHADGTFIENFEAEHAALVAGYWRSLCEVTRNKQIQTLLRDLRKRHSFRVYGALIDSTELLELEVFGQ
jgi:hypothetical protein